MSGDFDAMAEEATAGAAVNAGTANTEAAAAEETTVGAAVELRGVSFVYGEDAARDGANRVAEAAHAARLLQEGRVEDVSFRVQPGRCTILCGRSGEGKSTVLRLIDGLAGTFYPGKKTGTVYIDGCEVGRLDEASRTRQIGVVLQDPRSQFFMNTVADEIAFSAENLGSDPHHIVSAIEEVARLCGIFDLLGEKLSELSSGQKQRVALAAALVLEPSLLVLDEPLSNLDKQGVCTLVGVIARCKDKGMALVISEHRLHQLLPVADDLLYLKAGRIEQRWSAGEFAALENGYLQQLGLRHPDLRILEGAGDEQNVPQNPSLERQGWEVRDLTYRYRSTKRGITKVNALFPRGKVSVVCGPNGAGKTTLAKVLCGAVRVQRDAVLVDGKVPSRRKRRQMSYFVMQDADYQLYAGSVADEVVLGRKVDGALKARAWEALDTFDLADLADRHPASLSGGQKQRVTLAAAYCSDADLIVLDEPTSGLDGRGVVEVASWCRQLAAVQKTIVIITHDELLAKLAGDAVFELSTEPSM